MGLNKKVTGNALEYIVIGSSSKTPPKSKIKHIVRDPIAWARRLQNLKKRWPKQTLAERFWSKVKRGDSCWLWQAHCYPTGYGHFQVRKRKWEYAHRMAYILTHGSIPYDKHILHTCDNPPCVNPKHLWAGTPQDNMADMQAKGRRKQGGSK